MVSAIISTYNSEYFIENCLNDLLNQTLYQKGLLEIIVVDSNSQQNESDIVLEYQSKYSNITYLRTAQRETLYKAWNRAILLSQGEYITNANVDDIHSPESLEIMSNTLSASLDVDLVYGNHYLSQIENRPFDNYVNERQIIYSNYDPINIFLYYPFSHQPMWRKSVHNKVGYFDDTLKAAGDYDFAFKFVINGLKAQHINKFLGVQVDRKEQLSQSAQMNIEMNKVQIKYINSDNIFKVYRNAGFNDEDDSSKLLILNNIAKKSLGYYTPWNRGEMWANYNIAGVVCNVLFNITHNYEIIDAYIASCKLIGCKYFHVDNLIQTTKSFFEDKVAEYIIQKIYEN